MTQPSFLKNDLLAASVVPYRRNPPSSQPESLYPPYVGTRRRSPARPLILLPHTLSEVTGPLFGHEKVTEVDQDLTRQHAGEPLGERIVVSGKVMDEGGRAVAHSLIEIWQANAAEGIFTTTIIMLPRLIPTFLARDERLPMRKGIIASSPFVPEPIPGAIMTMRGDRLTFIFRYLVPHL